MKRPKAKHAKLESNQFGVPIKDELRSSLILGLKSRLSIALILSFLAHSEEILFLLQKLNHSTRAYIQNAKGLKGFLVPLNIIHELDYLLKDEALCNPSIQYETEFEVL